MNSRNGLDGLGDIVENEGLRAIEQGLEYIGRQRWIVKPEWKPKAVPGLEPVQTLLDHHLVPRLWQLLSDNYVLLRKGVYRVQKPGWIEPPFTSEPEDRVSETAVALAATDTVVVSYQVPDRHVASFTRFGHMLDVAAQWGTVNWTIQINKRPVRTYQNFRQQRGTVVEPTPLAKPITLKPKDLLEIVANLGGGAAVNATARIMGWSIAAASITQDGTAKDWNVR